MKDIIKHLIFFILVGCEENVCQLYPYESQFNYETNFHKETKNGIKVDDTQQDIDLNEIDRLAEETINCLIDNFSYGLPDYPKLNCITRDLNIPSYSCFKVKIPNNWFLSEDKTQQFLPSKAPNQLCEDKGLIPTAEHPCYWRGGIQDETTIVTTPSMVIFKDPLIRVITSCNNPWVGGLEKCAIKE